MEGQPKQLKSSVNTFTDMFIYKLVFLFLILSMCLYVKDVPEGAGACRGYKVVADLLELELRKP